MVDEDDLLESKLTTLEGLKLKLKIPRENISRNTEEKITGYSSIGIRRLN